MATNTAAVERKKARKKLSRTIETLGLRTVTSANFEVQNCYITILIQFEIMNKRFLRWKSNSLIFSFES